MTTLILAFDDAAAGDVAFTGGKGSSLSRLKRAGFPVPDGFVVSAGAYRAFRDQDSSLSEDVGRLDFGSDRVETLRQQCAKIRARWAKLSLPPALATALSDRLPSMLARGPVAVRSSSTFEDLAGAAFAGQHDTFLNRSTVESVLAATAACFASLWEDRAVRYRHERGYGQEGAAMAVVIQSMVASEAAGVAFTIHPVTGDPGKILVNSAFGLGETVVSGEGDVDQFVIDRKTGAVLAATIAEKTHAIVGDADGTRVLDVEAARRRAPSLTAGEIEELWKLCVDVERHAGFPQDIEWGIANGRVYLLQSRPVTKIPDRWTRDESAERFPNVVTPLSWDFAGEAFHRSLAHSLALMSLPPVEGHWFERKDGYIYGNQTAVRLFTTGAPPVFRDLDDLRRILPELRERFPWVERLPVAWARDLDRYLLRLGALSLSPADLALLDATALWRHVRAISDAGSEYFLPNIAISLTHGLLHRSLFRFLNLVAPPAEAASMYDRLMAFCETKTSVVNADLQELAQVARRDRGLETLIREVDRRTIWCESRLSSFPAFEAAFQKFLGDHGHREVDWDAFHPTWSGQPWVVLENVRLLLEQGKLADPEARAIELREVQQRAEAELSGLLSEDMRFFAAELVRLCRGYTALDDVEHYQTTRLNPIFRRALVEVGSRLVSSGVLKAPEEVFFLRRATLDALFAEAARSNEEAARSNGEATREAREAGAEYRRQAARTPPWVFGETPSAPPGGALRGLPGSPGIAEGPVFRVFSVEDFGRFPAGAVLVARTTNPAWTPLFYSACAVVTESGGPLSHGAVTAREVGIPAVMAVHRVLEALEDGMRVRVDGSAGFVERTDGDKPV